MPNRTQRLNENAKRNPYLKTSLKYPLDVETEGLGHIVLFNINTVSGSKFNTSSEIPSDGPVIQRPGSTSVRARTSLSRNTKRIDTSIALHLPNSLLFNYNTSWNNQDMGMAAKSWDLIHNWDEVTMEQVWTAIKSGTGNIGASILQQLTPINARDMLDFGRGTIKNPYKEMLFSGVNNRVFTWQFKFTPRNKAEAESVKQICYQFKLHQAPEITGKYGRAYFLYPSEFDISFIGRNGQENEWISKISTCALTACEITYGDEGGHQSHDDNSPVEISLNLTFMEMETLTKNRIEEGGF
jgi:hypothetical protein